MAKLDLTKYGITGATVIAHNPSYEKLFEEETKAGLEGYEKGQQTELGAVNVMTGIYTGRSPKDKYIVMDENSKDTVWWTTDEYKNDNHPMSEEVWGTVKNLAVKELCNKNLYDFIDVDELANMIVAASVQDEINGIINVCTGKPMSLAERVEQFLKDKNYKIRLNYGAFPDRPYDSPGTWGDPAKINKILSMDTYKKA